jgi:hypothetical protein
MTAAFRDEDRCRRLLESIVWPLGRICPACGYKRSLVIAGRDMGKRRARPGLYQCSSATAGSSSVTAHTPLHTTKLAASQSRQGPAVLARKLLVKRILAGDEGRSGW